MSESKKLNGSVDLLAKAMRDVFNETLEHSRKESRKDMAAMEQRLGGRIDSVDAAVETTNKNMSAQFIEQEKKISKMMTKR